MDRNKCRLMQEALAGFLTEFEKRFDVVVRVGNAKFSDASATIKVECAEKNAAGQAMTEDVRKKQRFAEYLKRDAEMYGLPKDAFGMKFKFRGEEYEAIGINPHARKNILIVKNTRNGTEYVMPTGFMLDGLGMKKPAAPAFGTVVTPADIQILRIERPKRG